MKYISRLIDRFFDLFFQCNTNSYVKTNHEEDYFDYEPTPVLSAIKVFRLIKIHKEDMFVDYGCGMGRMLILASKFGCRNIVGIDNKANAFFFFNPFSTFIFLKIIEQIKNSYYGSKRSITIAIIGNAFGIVEELEKELLIQKRYISYKECIFIYDIL